MKIKSGVWYWLAVASGAVGLLYGMGLELSLIHISEPTRPY